MGDIEKDRKEINRLIKKSAIKEVNGMDYSGELEVIDPSYFRVAHFLSFGNQSL